jgi:diaminohydroxyphosphoribosylaminopyrimidine deaminase/5-amino-6-(5-phosphoribosylamino)uracil reductase
LQYIPVYACDTLNALNDFVQGILFFRRCCMTDTEYMRFALQLAKKGCGWTNPNPMVGAVIVKDGKIIGQGYHRKYGELHAERNALASCHTSPEGAAMYVTLEPCCHSGKTPPCTEAILESGIRHVVIGSCDPNPLVAGKGIELLRSSGIEVTKGVLKEECDSLNQSFFHYIQNKTPYVIMKYAMTLDGKIATHTGKSQWITGEAARHRVHEDRHRYSAIMAGVGTVLSDDPLLTCRLENSRNPLRIVCDTHLKTPLSARIVTTTGTASTLLATAVTDKDKHRPYLEAGCDILILPQKEGHIDLNCLMTALGERKIDSVLLEGGGTLNWSALQNGIVHKVQAYIAPKLFGGSGKTPVMGLGVDGPDQAFHLGRPAISWVEEDILLESEVIRCSQES